LGTCGIQRTYSTTTVHQTIMTTIRRIDASEVEEVTKLAHLIWPDTFRDILKPEQLQFMLEWMYNPETLSSQIESGHQFFLLENEQDNIGFMGIQVAYPSSGLLKIHKLYVLPSQQGRGYGKLLIEHAISVANSTGNSAITLNVNRFNKSVKFYQAIGFQITKEEDIDIGRGYLMEDYVMELVL
jgi:ribosomal protein S18 acetylase RimI-like enzyme